MTYAAFIDYGFLRAESTKELSLKEQQSKPNASQIYKWCCSMHLACGHPDSTGFLRAYWYDGEFPSNHDQYQPHKKFLDAIAGVPGIQMRLGQVVEQESKLQHPIEVALRQVAHDLGISHTDLKKSFDNHFQFHPDRAQKGVDTLIALDMVRLAGRGVYDAALLVAGDRDLAEAIKASQDFGARVVVATPRLASVAREIRQIADAVIEIQVSELEKMFSAAGSK